MVYQARRINKYNAVKTEYNGRLYDSKAEAKRAAELQLLQRIGEIREIEYQPVFDLPGNTKYKADFRIYWADGRVTIEDVKGFETQVFRLKKRQVEEIHKVKIEVLK